jgi:phosphoglycerate kinase
MLFIENFHFTCARSSMVGIDLSHRVAGFLMKKELDAFSQVIETPKRPLLAVLGG